MGGVRSTYRQWKRRSKLFWAINWWKSLYFNFKMFPFSIARKLPVLFYGSVKLRDLSGKIIIDAPIKKGMIGFGQPYEFFSREKGIAELALRGTMSFKGHAQFGKDYQIQVDSDAHMEMGHMASLASSGRIICKDKIVFGTHARIGSESQLMDTNFHQMKNTETGALYPMTGPIILGDYNFVSNRVTFMQGTVTPNYCTIASNTLCNKNYTSFGENVLIGGIPAKLLKTNITRDWEGEQEMMEKYLKLF